MTHQPPIVLDVEQGSDAWLAARSGLLTASRAGAMLATVKGKGEAAARRDLRSTLVCERLIGQPIEGKYVSADMRRGRELEADAVRAYEARRGRFVTRVGFMRSPTLAAGCSPDGLIGRDGVLEVKCPRALTHLEYWRTSPLGVPAEYLGQVLHSLFITGAAFCDFVSWDPRFPPGLQFFCVRHERQEFEMAIYERTLLTFLDEVDAELAAVKALIEAAA